MKRLAMVLDCEAIGIQGQAFAYGYVVLNLVTGKLEDARRRWCSPDLAHGLGRNMHWVKANVPLLPSCAVHPEWNRHDRVWREDAAQDGFADALCDLSSQVSSTQAVREDFWRQWRRWSLAGADLWADVAWPVEARFLVECVEDGRDGVRHYDGPYPLLDVATLLAAHGEAIPSEVADLPVVKSETIRPDGVTENFYGSMLSVVFKHDPLGDAYVSAQRLLRAVRRDGLKIDS